MSEIKLNKRQIDALKEVALYDEKGHPHNWRAASCKVLEQLGLVTPCRSEHRRGYLTLVRHITDAGREVLKQLPAPPHSS